MATMNDTQSKIGKLLTEDEGRDAIHIAVAAVVAGEKLKAGQHIGFVENNIVGTDAPSRVGIVDPYLTEPVAKGARFWMFLYPNTITGLRHEWLHPAFHSTGGTVSPSEAWLRTFAEEQAGISYDHLMWGAADYLKNGEYLVDGGRWEGFRFDADEFWRHYEAVTGVRVDEKDRYSFFSCSC